MNTIFGGEAALCPDTGRVIEESAVAPTALRKTVRRVIRADPLFSIQSPPGLMAV
jgi:hypothetical protein